MRSVTFYNFLLEATLTGSLLILLLLLGRATLGKRVKRVMIYGAWLLVVLRLLLPLSFPNPLMNELRPRLSANYAARPIADQIRVRAIDAVYDVSVALAGNDVTELEGSRLFQLGISLEKGMLGSMLLVVYCGGAAATMGVLMWRNLRFRRRLRRGRVEQIPAERLGDFPGQCARRKIRPLPVWRVEGLTASCVAGWLHPFIALPANIQPESYSLALRHEMAHLQLRDGWWNLLRCICCVVHWFNPLVWLGASLSRLDGEIACDERVFRELNPEEQEAYIQKLGHAARKHSMPELGVQASGIAMKPSRVALRQRLLRENRQTSRRTAVFVLLAVLLAAFSFFTGEQEYTPSVEDAFNIMADMQLPEDRISRQAVETPEDAAIWFKKLLQSPFIQAEHRTPSVQWNGKAWEGTAGGFTVRFNREGVITSFRNETPLESTMKSKPLLLTNPQNEALYTYVRAFTKSCLPDVAITQMHLQQSQTSSSGCFITCDGGNTHCASAYRFIVQVEPRLRVVSFSLLDTPERALIRVSGFAGEVTDQPSQSPAPTGYITMRQAREIAQDRVSRAGGAPELMSSVSRLDEADPDQPVWNVTYNMNGKAYYEVCIDANNGEVLVFTDHREQTVERAEDQEGTPAPGELSKAEAIALARQAVAKTYSFTEQEVAHFLVFDANYIHPGTEWCGYRILTYAWLVSLRMPETDLSVLSDYDVVLDAATGETLHIFDPSNNANG